jgi:hypothetical protein
LAKRFTPAGGGANVFSKLKRSLCHPTDFICLLAFAIAFSTNPVRAQEPAVTDLGSLGIEVPSANAPENAVELPTTNFNNPTALIPDELPLRTPFDVAMESIFGEASADNWRPLSFRTFLSEGWNEPFVFTPRSTSGAPRQGWINSFDGVMYRLWFNAFGYRQNVANNGNSYFSDWSIFLPLNRRLDIRFDVPYINANKGGAQNKYLTQFGDLNVTARFLLAEDRDTSVIAVSSISIPTGRVETGGGSTQLGYGLQFWHSMRDRWIFRGGANVVVPVNNYPEGIRTNGNVNMAIGKYITEPGTPIFGDLVIYTSANLITSLDNKGSNNTFFCLTPGYRAEITDNWYHLAGVEIPMVGGPSYYTYGLQFWILKVF